MGNEAGGNRRSGVGSEGPILPGLPDYHVHLENGAYSLDWVSRFLERAAEVGLSEVGFSEHGHRFKEAGHILEIDWAREQCTQRVGDYVDLVERARSLGYPLKVRLGIEMDFVPGKEEEIAEFIAKWPWDFVIGSVHWDGALALDDPEHRWEDGELLNTWRKYFELVESMASSGLYDIVGHFDVIKVNAQRPPGMPMEDAPHALSALRAIAAAGLCLEVSSAGLRKPVGEPYPHRSFLKRAKEMGIPVTLASDAHEPEDVGRDFSRLLENLREAGYTEVLLFEGRRKFRRPI